MGQEVRSMNRQFAALLMCGGIALLASACATKGFVREHVGATETRITTRVDDQESKLRETSDRTASNTQAIEAAGQRLQSLDGRVGEATTLATEAKKDAAVVAAAQKEAEASFNQRFKDRNKYSMVETKLIYFDFNKSDLKDEGMTELEEVAKALKADPNAVLELQGYADQRGPDRYNYQLTRERVEAVTRYLVQRHGIDLRRIHAVGMGKAGLASGEKPGKETYSKSRRVEIRLFTPQS
jgi:outer membrane protein OmpA-like peptidoglycan-associated protein